MKVLTKITDTISKVAEWIIMAMILGLVGLIVTELCRRNFLNQSWLPTTELCGMDARNATSLAMVMDMRSKQPVGFVTEEDLVRPLLNGG